MDENLCAAPQCFVGYGVHVAHDHVRLVAGLEERVGAPVHADQDRLERADVGLHHAQVALVARTACHHERMAVTEARLQSRELDPFGEQLPFLPEVAHRVLGKCLERFGDSAALFGELPFELPLLEHVPRRKTRSIAVETSAANGQELSLVHMLEEAVGHHVDQPDASTYECERSWIWKASGLRRGHVDHYAYSGFEECFRRDAIEIGVVDDRDVVRREPFDEILGAPVQLRVPGELDETHHLTLARNSRPPSMRCNSSRRSPSLRSLMRV